MGLPPSFSSLYRLFLRTTSAAVLHHTTATRHLGRLWRPAFQTAARVVKRLSDDAVHDEERQRLENWMQVWEHRMDNTLRLLYNSAVSRGLPHDLTRNLSFLLLGYVQWWRRRHFTPASQPWNPQRPPSPPIAPPKPKSKEEKRKRWRDLDDRAWGALEEVVRMAEGRHGVSLGKVEMKRPLYRDTV